jgi:hypothetical protein
MLFRVFAVTLLFSFNYAFGDDALAFFTTDGASSPFNGKISLSTPPQLQILPPQRPTKNPTKEKVSKNPSESESTASIVERFGDPTKRIEITADDKAPVPMKGILAALHAGDRKLALQYAKQYSNYITDVEKSAKMVTTLQALAGMTEDELSSAEFDEGGDFEGLRELYKKSNTKESAYSEVTGYSASLNEEALKILSEASEEEGGIASQELSIKTEKVKLLSEEEERATIRQQLLTKIPRDPQGKVVVYLFFDPKNSSSLKTLQLLDQIARSFSGSDGKRPVIVGLSSVLSSGDELGNIQSYYQLQIPLRSGSKLAADFGVKDYPTTVFLAPSIKKIWIEEGAKSAIFYTEAIKLVRGDGVAVK